ncbi:hypothetical protein BHYA_0007g00580 [Botrytis hyacinthi]|uniref:Uncharacterized protein n=1 Tax=Botrytis hyacinthi TaxID=278943 RepID=A0A4Z1H133_9HELO|nr:hypothetical protein BHYA_0007g00580 [Botrytis hyacinthi]
MFRLTYVTAAIASALAQAPGFTFIYLNPPNPLRNYPSSHFSDQELLWHKGRRQFSAIILFLFTFSMTFLSFALRIRNARGNRNEHEDALKAKTCAELVIDKTALKKEQERLNRIEQVMESLQAQVGVLRARLTVRDAEARIQNRKVQAMAGDRQSQAHILATRIMTQEAKMEEVLEKLDENGASHDAIEVWIEKFNSEGEKTKEELKKFDCVDKEINALYHYLVKEACIIREIANGDLEKLRAHVSTVERRCKEEFQRIHGDKQIRERDLRDKIRTEVQDTLRREQDIKDIDELWRSRFGKGKFTKEKLITNQEVEEDMETEVTDTDSRVQRSSQAEVEGDVGGDKKQEADASAETETPIQDKTHPLYKAVEDSTQSSIDQERDAEMKDLEQGKDEVMEDITHELENGAEAEEKDNDSDEEWTELRY